MSKDKLLAVEWSPTAKQSNIQFLSETLENNLRYLKTREGNVDWLLVAVTEDDMEASRIAARIEKEFG